MLGRPGCDFSFSGLKTALLHAVQAMGSPSLEDPTAPTWRPSFQTAVAEVLADRTPNAIALLREL